MRYILQLRRYSFFTVVGKSITLGRRRCSYLRLRVIGLAGQDAEVPRGGDRHQALDVFDKLLVVLGVPEHHAVLLSLWLGEGVDHRAATVAPLRKRQKIQRPSGASSAAMLVFDHFQPGSNTGFWFSTSLRFYEFVCGARVSTKCIPECVHLVVWSNIGEVKVRVHSQADTQPSSLPGHSGHLLPRNL